jgi:polyhydroxybutyrate depolymerase
VALLIGLFALGGARAGAQAGGACATTPTPGNSTVTIESGGLQRTAVVYVPPVPAGTPLPVLLAMHGANQNGTFFENYTGFSTIARDEGFIAVYPNATVYDGETFWTINDDRPGSADDVQFISDLVQYLEANLCVAPGRVYATGVSNGGGMTARLACQLSGDIVAAAPIAGGYSTIPSCTPQQPVSVIEVHGSSDGTVPYNGKPPDGAGAVPAYLRMWRALDRCSPTPHESEPAPRVLQTTWGPCADGTTVTGVEIYGGGHQLPGGFPPDKGQNATLSVPWLAWSFLRRQHRG